MLIALTLDLFTRQDPKVFQIEECCTTNKTVCPSQWDYQQSYKEFQTILKQLQRKKYNSFKAYFNYCTLTEYIFDLRIYIYALGSLPAIEYISLVFVVLKTL